MPEISSKEPAESPNRYQAEQIRCIERIRELKALGDDAPGYDLQDVYKRLLKVTIPLIRTIIKRCLATRTDTSMTAEDLEGEAVVTLMNVIDSYNEAQSAFSTYLTTAVHRRLSLVLMRDAIIRGSDGLQQELWQARADFLQTHGREPEDEDLVREYGFTAEILADLRRAQRVGRGSKSHEEGGDSWESSFGGDEEKPEDALILGESVENVIAALGRLHQPDAAIIRMRFGITDENRLGAEPMSFKDIAAARGCPTGTVSDGFKRGMNALRKALGADQEVHEPPAPAMRPVPPPAVAKPSEVAPNIAVPALVPVEQPILPQAVDEEQKPSLPALFTIERLQSIPPPQRTDYGAHLGVALSQLPHNNCRRVLQMLHEYADIPLEIERIASSIWKVLGGNSLRTAQRYVGHVRTRLAEDHHRAGMIHLTNGESAYRLTTRSWEHLPEGEDDLLWPERALFELLAEWEGRPISRKEIAAARLNISDGALKGIPNVVHGLRKKRRGIVAIGDGYLYNSGTNIPQVLLSELTYHEYVVLSICLQQGVGTPVPRARLFEALSFAHSQVGRKPLRPDSLTFAVKALIEKVAKSGHGVFERSMKPPPAKPTILDCTLKEWNSPLPAPEPDPVVSFEVANARRFAVFLQGFVYTIVTDDELPKYFGETNEERIGVLAQKFVPPGFCIARVHGRGWSLIRPENGVPPGVRLFDGSEVSQAVCKA